MVACAGNQTLCLLRDSRVYACGQGESGQNGVANGKDRHRIQRVRGLQDIVMVAAGLGYSAALDSVGAVLMWGDGNDGWDSEDENGVPRQGPHVPRRIAPENFGGSLAQIVSVGSDFWGVVTARGELWICGDGTHGCFGCWDRKDRAAPTLVRGAWGGSQVLMVSCGRWHTVAVTVAGMVWTWGEGRQFKLGHGDLEDQVFPIQIAPGAFGDSHMVLASAEAGMTMAVTRENILHVLGTGHLGRVDPDGDVLDGNISISRVPVPVEESLCPGTRVGWNCGLKRRECTAFCMGMHARLGESCVHQAAPTDMLTMVEQQSRILTDAYACMSEGLLRLLAVRERVD